MTDARDAARYRWLRGRIILRKAGPQKPTNITVHLDSTFTHGVGMQIAPSKSIEAEMAELDERIDAALGDA